MNKDLDKALKAKFLCQTKFTQDIENLVKDNDDLNYIDAIVHYCEQNKIEVDSCLLYTSDAADEEEV